MSEENIHDEAKLAVLEKFYRNRYLAHSVLFAHRRKQESPEFHRKILDLFYSQDKKVLVEAFRGGAKSTLMEEYILLSVLFRDFLFPIIIGNSHQRACDRIAAIKNELVNNDALIELFGNQQGDIWAADQISLANGAKIQAFGAGQSLRGAKHIDNRPDLGVVDDLEDEDMVATELSQHKLQRWFDGGFVPALVPDSPIRMIGTPLHPKSLLEVNRRNPNWKSIVVPAMYIDDMGIEQSSWPERFPLKLMQDMRHDYTMKGRLLEFEQEMMCRSEDIANKPFQADMIRSGPVPVGYHPVEIFVDPARTVNNTSARTGYVAWSWVGTKLYVHEGRGEFHKPDEIIDEMFKLNERYSPAAIGVELDGLEEFLMQPLRTEQIKRGITLPIVPMRAPRNKPTFITSLQPFYRAGEVIHVGNCRDLESELLAFPTGRVDVPNALAYALKMRAGQLVYEDFSSDNILEGMVVDRRAQTFLAISSYPAMTAAALIQFKDNNIKVMRDWVISAPPMEAVPIILPEAILETPDFKAICPIEQADKYINNGMGAAFRGTKIELRRGASAAASIGSLSQRLHTRNKGMPAFLVSNKAKWTINAMFRGYARKMGKDGSYEDYPTQGGHALLMEAIESFDAYVKIGNATESGGLVTAYTQDGRQYFSALPRK